jgi:hypothetical protein
MSNVEKTIERDLRALGENSRRDVPALDSVPALRTADAYRDDRPGAEARRNALAEERRREMVLMPLTLAHVFAHRSGRIAAGAMSLAVSAVMLMMVADPLLIRFAAWFVPGLNMGMLIMIAAMAITGSYVLASWIAEAWFARRMRASLKTGDDAYHDLDHLAQGPIEIAQRACKKLDGWSMGLFLAGATSVTLVFGYAIVVVGTNHTLDHAWSMLGIVDTGALQRNVGTVGFAVMVACTASFFVGRACATNTAETSPLTKGLASWAALVVAGVVAIVMAYNCFHLIVRFHSTHVMLSPGMRSALTIGATVAIFVPTAWILLAWRRREHTRID